MSGTVHVVTGTNPVSGGQARYRCNCGWLSVHGQPEADARQAAQEHMRLQGWESWPKDTPGQRPLPQDRRAEVLDAAKALICGDRDLQYGSPENNFRTIAALWRTYLNQRFGSDVQVEALDVAAMMSLFKIARIAADSGKLDSWIDLAGYAACGAEVSDAK